LDAQYTANIPESPYVSHPNSPYSLLSQYHNLSAIKGLNSRSQSDKEENNKKGQVEKTTSGEVDLVDIAYPIFRRWKDKNNKIEEMTNYFPKYNSRIYFLLIFL
jgi:hypothetical protein